MCTGAELAFLASAAATTTQAVNANQAMRRQDEQLARGLREQGELQRQANQRVMEQAGDIAGSTGEPERAESLAGFQQALRRSDESSTDAIGGGDAAVGAANPRFAERVSQGEAQVRGDALESAGRLARIDAPTFQRMNEGFDVGRTAEALNRLGRRSDAADFITRLRASEERPNPWIDALAQIVKGGASAYALKPGGTGTAPSPTMMDSPGTVQPPTGNPFTARLRRNA